ncbi:MAG: AMP-binding protein, partial [Myxococcota bacterium]
YGLTEAFRSTYLPPEEVDRRPDSIGKAIPNQEILVLRDDGNPCKPGEIGELVHRGSTVSLGYWNDADRTAERFRSLPRRSGIVSAETAVFSGDQVKLDDEGFLYFVGRNDEMLKSSGYRISPVEIEEAIYSTGMAKEVAAVGIPDDRLGHKVAVILLPTQPSDFTKKGLMDELSNALPTYMLPGLIEVKDAELPRNNNGKIDRKRLKKDLEETLAVSSEQPPKQPLTQEARVH